MGCLDWLKRLGNMVPPVTASQLPADYQEKDVQQHIAKNQLFAKIWIY